MKPSVKLKEPETKHKTVSILINRIQQCENLYLNGQTRRKSAQIGAKLTTMITRGLWGNTVPPRASLPQKAKDEWGAELPKT